MASVSLTDPASSKNGGTLITMQTGFSSGMLLEDVGNRTACGLGRRREQHSGVDLCLRGQDLPRKRNGSRPTGTGGNSAEFPVPCRVENGGAIPLSSSAVAARTTRTKQAELFNSFTQVKHSSIFELVKLGDTGRTGHSEAYVCACSGYEREGNWRDSSLPQGPPASCSGTGLHS